MTAVSRRGLREGGSIYPQGIRRYQSQINASFCLFDKLCAGLPEFSPEETRRTSVILSVSVSASVGMGFVWLASFAFLTLSVFTPFSTHTNTQTGNPLASCASGGMM